MRVSEQCHHDETGGQRSQGIAYPEDESLVQVIDRDAREQAKGHGGKRKRNDGQADHDRRVGDCCHDDNDPIIGGIQDDLRKQLS